MLASGCCSEPWVRYPRSTPPDESYSYGPIVAGDDVYSWRCDRGEHVVVYFASSEMSCGGAKREIVPCAQETPYERANSGRPRKPIRPTMAWR
jgi:hypothetical protein